MAALNHKDVFVFISAVTVKATRWPFIDFVDTERGQKRNTFIANIWPKASLKELQKQQHARNHQALIEKELNSLK